MHERLPPIPPELQTVAQRQAVAEIIAGPRGKLQGPFVALMRSPELMQRVQALGEQLRYRFVLGERLKELAILIVARRWTQQTEWLLHLPMALEAGVRAELAEAIARGQRPTDLAEDEAVVHDFCIELLAADFRLSDAMWSGAVAAFGQNGTVELIGLVGNYTLLAMVMNASRTALPDGATPPLAPL